MARDITPATRGVTAVCDEHDDPVLMAMDPVQRYRHLRDRAAIRHQLVLELTARADENRRRWAERNAAVEVRS